MLPFRFSFYDEAGTVLYDSPLPFRINFGATGTVEVLQNLAVLFMTPIRSQTLDRELGLDMSFIDKPMPVAQNMLISEMVEKLEQFEDRLEIRDVEFLPSRAEAGHLYAKITIRFRT